MSYLYSVSDEVSLSGVDIVLIVIGVIFLIIGLVAAITVGVLLGMKIKKCCGINTLHIITVSQSLTHVFL